MESEKRSRIFWFLLSIYVVALIIRILIIKYTAWNATIHYESAEIAKFIIQGNGYWWDWYGTIPPQPTAILPPIYTYFTALFMALLENPARAFYIAQAILSSLCVIPGYFLGRQLANNKTGIVTAVLFAVFPEIAFMSAKPVAESLLMPIVILIFYLFLKYKAEFIKSGNIKQFFWLGLLIGAATLIKTTAAFIIPAGFISLILLKSNRLKAICAAFLLSLGFLTAIAPWSIRNTLVLGKPIMLNTMYGFNLWRGNHPGATGTGRLDKDRISEDSLDPEYKKYIELNHPNTELEIDKFYLDEAARFIKSDPMRYVGLCLKRMVYFLTFDPTSPLTNNIIYLGGYFLALIFGVWGGLILAKEGKLDNIFIFTPLVFLLFYVPVIILPRYRLTVIWILVGLSAVSTTRLLSKIKFIDKFVDSIT
jgi:4-amino-4-deoxy-L-arabinose transferase-like glycosyltransferase